ncbi:protein Star isoform X2 [Anopheles bellator]|nr:protein Star isoform X2 [Anopheles bellator]
MRTKVQEKKEKMSTDEQQQENQNQIPNIAGTIVIGGLDGPVDFDIGQQKQSLAAAAAAANHPQNHHHLNRQYPPPGYILPHLHQFCTMPGSNPTSLTGATGGQKHPSKGSPVGPSPLWQLLPVMLCVISFATVLSILVIYMDTTEIRHQQFRLNMSRDYNLMGVPQDNPALIKYVRDIHMKKYPMTFMRTANAPTEQLNFNNRHELTPEMAHVISDLLGRKRFGTFFQSLAGNSDSMMTAPWLAETMNWGGYLVEPDPRKYFSLRKQNAFRPNVQVIHACLSPNTYPKEVTLHHDDDSEVQINSVLDEETEWFHPRVKCFPVYTLMLAVNHTSIDLLSLGCHGQELQILQTIPFDRVHIKIISIHLVHYYEEDEMLIDVDEYVQSIGRFLMSKSYKLVRSFDRNFIYQHISVASAAKQRQQQQQQLQQLRQQHTALPDGASSGNGGIVAPPQQAIQAPHGNAISSGEKVDLTMAIRKGQEGAGIVKVPISLSPSMVKALPLGVSAPTAAPTTTASSSTFAVNSLPSTTGRSLSSKTGEKLVLLRGSETDDANDSEFFDAEFTSDNTNESEEELKQPPQQRQSFEDETREELDESSVRAANVLPPMVSTL